MTANMLSSPSTSPESISPSAEEVVPTATKPPSSVCTTSAPRSSSEPPAVSSHSMGSSVITSLPILVPSLQSSILSSSPASFSNLNSTSNSPSSRDSDTSVPSSGTCKSGDFSSATSSVFWLKEPSRRGISLNCVSRAAVSIWASSSFISCLISSLLLSVSVSFAACTVSSRIR